MGDVRISTTPQGPYHVEGTVTLIGDDGTEIEGTDDMWLCRCGGSANKPFCDGTHNKIGGFAPAEAAREALAG
ncbi:MAG: hypothetical protein NVSMB32_01500 [Actinomycetota bacterium]